MTDQASSLRDMANRLREQVEREMDISAGGRVLVVVSGKGGVGKTAISTNLAMNLVRRGARVALFDADLGLANADIMLGMAPTSSVFDLARLGADWEPPAGDFHLIGGGSGSSELLNLQDEQFDRLLLALRNLQGNVDLTLVDAGAGLNLSVLSFMAEADEIMLVTTPEPTALTDAYATLKMIALHNRSAQVWLICNRVSGPKQASETLERLRAVSQRFLGLKPVVLGHVVEDRHLRQAIIQQRPLLDYRPRAGATRCIAAMSDRLLTSGAQAMPTDLGRMFGLIRRLTGRGH